MCGRFSLFDLLNLKVRYNIDLSDWIKPRYNIAPSQDVLAIVKKSSNHPLKMKWGILPFWSRDSSSNKILINARKETVDQKPTFKHSFKGKRCLIPADGFYEWEKKGSKKIPYRFTLKDGGIFSIAGLWDSWSSPQGEIITACALITAPANELLKPIHNRMPVILDEEAEQLWLAEDAETHLLKDLLQPYPENLMAGYKLSTKVNSPQNDGPEVLLSG